MSALDPNAAPAAGNSHDWDQHWTAYAEAALNPAQTYRRKLVFQLLALHAAPRPTRLLELGSGQGEPFFIYRFGRAAWGPIEGALAAVAYTSLPITLGFSNFHALEGPVIAGIAVASWGYARFTQTWRTGYAAASISATSGRSTMTGPVTCGARCSSAGCSRAASSCPPVCAARCGHAPSAATSG